MRGGVGLESAQLGFAPRAPRATLDEYAREVADQLEETQSQMFEFVLIHPARSGAHAAIWGAFESFISACKQS